MRISTRARYGTRLMISLGRHHGEGPILLKNIAKEEAISEKYLSQLIIPLRVAGLVNSYRGAHGGYTLASPPEDISLKAVVEALEGDFNLLECTRDVASCEHSSACAARELWTGLGRTISGKLASFTVGDLVNRSRELKSREIAYSI